MKDYQTVKLKHDIPKYNLRAGDSGVIVDVYRTGDVEVEFFTKTGETKAVLTLGEEGGLVFARSVSFKNEKEKE